MNTMPIYKDSVMYVSLVDAWQLFRNMVVKRISGLEHFNASVDDL